MVFKVVCIVFVGVFVVLVVVVVVFVFVGAVVSGGVGSLRGCSLDGRPVEVCLAAGHPTVHRIGVQLRDVQRKGFQWKGVCVQQCGVRWLVNGRGIHSHTL